MKPSLLSTLTRALPLLTSVLATPVPEPLEFVNEYGALEAIPPEHRGLDRRSPQSSDTACSNTANTRACWSNGFSIATDFDAKFPETGRDVIYNLEITNMTTLSPDGFNRLVLAVNGQYPGPTLIANWGDRMIVNVKNSLQHNGTSIHWHGLRQLNTVQHDGVGGVTECPLAPGETRQYILRCTQFGTSWYHSHYSAQYGDGVAGGIIINGPAVSNYDTDLGTMTFTDWYNDTAFQNNIRALHSTTGPPVPDSALINGTMKRADDMGSYHVTKVTKGKRFRIRLINIGIDNHFIISIDQHNFTVITSDFVPVKPYVATSVNINIGQRADIILTANQPIGNYWLRADIGDCGVNAYAGKVLSIIRYEGAPITDPTQQSTELINKPTACADEIVRPYVNNTVPQDQFTSAIQNISLGFNTTTTANNGSLVQWLIDGTATQIDWKNPTLDQVLSSTNNPSFALPNSSPNIIEIVSQPNSWTFWLLHTAPTNPVALPHPIHLHGHDFYILGSGGGGSSGSTWNGDLSTLQFNNPPRRDTATMPAGGYLVLGFPADNPGVWLMHCHIPWHVGAGLSLQFVERRAEIDGVVNGPAAGGLAVHERTCEGWKRYWDGPGRVYEMDDSGL